MRLLAFAVALAVSAVGVWLFGSPLSGAFADATGVVPAYSSLAFIGIWFALGVAALLVLRRRRTRLVLPAALALGVTALGVGASFGYTHLVDDRADDDVSFAASADRVSQGQFEAITKEAAGTARIVELPGGERRLVFTGFDVERAPDLRVYLAEERVDGDVGEYEDLGALRGNVGDQWYELPEDLDVRRYRHVVIWCRAFDVGVAQAELRT